MTSYYKDKLESGIIYQDFISDQLRQRYGIIVGVYSSARYQFECGESASGIEIKLDMKLQETGNIYIEVAEKSDASLEQYCNSGIMRDDNTWLYLIGNKEEAFLFSKSQLRSIVMNEKYMNRKGIRKTQTPTSIGYLFPREWALSEVYCLKHFTFTN